MAGAGLAVFASLALAPVAGLVQETRAADPLACAKTVDGAPIRIGTPVTDTDGKIIGSVSISQCMADANEPRLRVMLSSALGGDIKSFSLEGVEATEWEVTLPLTSAEIAAAPSADHPYDSAERG